MAAITKRVRLDADNKITDFVLIHCVCGLRQRITDRDAMIPGVFECECGAPFAIADVFGNVYRIGERIRKGVGEPYGE